MTSTNFSDSFNRLSNRFETIEADNHEDGERYLRSISADAATITKQAVEAGVLTGLNVNIRPPEAVVDMEQQEQLWALSWYAIVNMVTKEHSDQFPNPHLSRRAGDGRIVKAKDWRERGHKYASVCRWLAGMIEADDATDSTQRKPKRNKLPAATWLGGKRFQIQGSEPFSVPDNLAAIVAKVIQHGGACDSIDLELSGVPSASKYLVRERDSGRRLGPYITCPGGKGRGGYRVKIKDGRNQQ